MAVLEGSDHPCPLPNLRFDVQSAIAPFGGGGEEWQSQSHVARLARGKEGVEHTGQRLLVHPFAVVNDLDGQPVGLQVLLNPQLDSRRVSLDGVLQHVQDVQRQL